MLLEYSLIILHTIIPIILSFYITFKIIMGIRSLYSPCSNPHGTCFSLDSSTHSLPNPTPADMMEFERTLAAIIAMAQTVSNDRNPFFFNKFYGTIPWGHNLDRTKLELQR